mgnify:CR=1 FL=1
MQYIKEGKEMTNIQFNSLDEAIQCYGRKNLIAINNLHQIIFYTQHGCQPKFIFENEQKAGQITCWFLRDETTWIYERWLKDHPKQK